MFYVGLALTLLAGGRLALVSLGGYRRLRARQQGYERTRQQFVEQVAAAARTARATKPDFLGWSGARRLRISAIVDEALDVRSIYLTDPAGAPLPGFEPGQYLTCYFDTPPGDKPLVRCYSLSDRPREEYFRLTVKKCGPPAGQPAVPPGRGSNRLHAMQVGDELEVSAPRGQFYLDSRRDDALVLVAGGIGVTPLVSMAATLAEQNDTRPIYFFYGVRNSREQPFRDQLQEIGRQHPNFHQFVAYSQPLAEDRPQRDFQHRGRLSVEYLQSVLPHAMCDYYLCGPGGMMDELVSGLMSAGVSAERIRYEAFGPATVRRMQPAESASTEAAATGPVPTIRLSQSDQLANWDDDCDSLLELIEGLGVPIESGCRAGNCGMCAARVLEGDVKTVKPAGVPTPDGYCLACISVPQSPLVLEL